MLKDIAIRRIFLFGSGVGDQISEITIFIFFYSIWIIMEKKTYVSGLLLRADNSVLFAPPKTRLN